MLLALSTEVECVLTSGPTREGLARATASGKKVDRLEGSLGVSCLDGKEDEIRRFFSLDLFKTAIAKIIGESRHTLYQFLETRGLDLGSLP